MAQEPVRRFGLGQTVWFFDGRSGVVTFHEFNPVAGMFQYMVHPHGGAFLESDLFEDDPTLELIGGPGVDAPVEPPQEIPPFTPDFIPPPIFEPFVIDGLEEFTNDLLAEISTGLEESQATFEAFSDRFSQDIIDELTAVVTITDGTLGELVRQVTGGFTDLFQDFAGETNRLEEEIFSSLEASVGNVTGVVEGIDQRITADLEESEQSILDTLGGFASEILGGLGTAVDAVQDVDEIITENVTGFISGEIDSIEQLVSDPLAVLTESLPLQVAGLGDTIKDALSFIPDLPASIGDSIGGVFGVIASTLGLDQLLDFFTLVGRVTANLTGKLSASPDLETLLGSWDVPRDSTDQINTVLSALPILGSIIQTDHPAEFERIRQNSFEHTRPMQLDAGSTLELIRRFPEETENALGNLKRNGLPDSKIDQLLKIQHTPLPLLDNLDGWRRGEIDEDALDMRLRANGLSPDDMVLAKRLSRRIPPIQDLILFAVRGVFDVEESRRFGEFEGLPTEIEEQFIQSFGIEGGDFSRQVQVFADAAAKLGLPPEWVGAYWTAHWRLPSLQNAYQMFHRLAPDIVDAEQEDFVQDGFNPDDLKFDRASLDRLVRAADYSGFWRDKLSSIAYNPLTRVDIRRMHKLGILDNDAVQRAYRKVGFSPSDADKMLAFTIAFNQEPDQSQTDEIRALTKAQILDFVEAELFTVDEGIENLKAIGYSEFAAEGFVDLELARRERGLQGDAILLVEERVLAGLIDLNEATLELDTLGVPVGQRAGILRRLEVKLAKRTRQPTRAELDAFFSADIITQEQYRLGLLALGYPDEWADRFIQLNQE